LTVKSLSIYLLCLMLFLTSAAQAKTTPEIAVLLSYDSSTGIDLLNGFRSYFEQQGIEPRLTIHSLEKSQEKTTLVLAQLRETKPDMVLALGSLAVNSAGEQLTEVPVIASMVIDKAVLGKYKNVTGVALGFPLKEQVAWLRKIIPSARDIGVIYSSEENEVQMASASILFKRNGLILQQKKIAAPTDLMPSLKQLKNSMDALWGVSDAMVLNSKTAQSLLLFSLRQRIPFIGLSKAWVKAGALYALERDYFDVGQQCAEMAKQSLAGKGINNIAVMTPRTIRYSLNLKIAKKIKIELSQEIIAGAETRF
jgi:putative ABC transport system substrate-binding protein